MSVLSHIGNPDSGRRRDKRERFMDQFLRLPFDAFSIPDLAKKTRIPSRTVLAYVQQLHRQGLVKHECCKSGRFGFQFYIAVWSRVK